MKTIRSATCLLLVALLASGCQLTAGDGGALPATDNGGGSDAKAAGKLVRADSASLLAHFRDVLAASAETAGDADKAPALESASAADAGGTPVSTTNLQEAGVDEADLLKTSADGRFIYAVRSGAPRYGGGPIVLEDGAASDVPEMSPAIRVMAASGDGALTELTSIPLDDAALEQKGLYLLESANRLVALDRSVGLVYAYWFRPGHFARQRTRLRFIDIADPAKAAVVGRLGFDGALVASRRVGDVVYLVLRHYPDLFIDGTNAKGEGAAPELDIDRLLPHYRIDGVDQGLLVEPGACYLNRDAAVKSADVISIVAVDLRSDGRNFNSRCYVGASEALYASTRALYLASTRHPYRHAGGGIVYDDGVTTDIHKFAFAGLDLDYRGSAEVKGHLGWHQDQKSFRFSESASGDLRVITFNEPRRFFFPQPVDDAVTVPGEAAATRPKEETATPDPGQSPVRLTILREAATRAALEVVSALPNRDRPEPIGRPGEQLYGSRYIGDRAFLVTFRVTDPLYVLDLSDPTDPRIAGELKISGYSDYLHPVTETLLLGIGKEAIAAPSVGAGDFGGAWYQGIKLSLIDISDPARPREVDRLEIGKRGTSSAALQAHHAVTTLRIGDTMRVALPIELHDTPSKYGDPASPSYYYDYSRTALYRFNIDSASQRIDATPVPLVVADRNGGVRGSWNDRSVMIGDYVHYFHAGRFWSQHWVDGTIAGPR